ncbi:MAG: fibrobacter succinogenes major paralogous domain-containing protein, partial [Muribaculaceae bacterium]|nr:fibrobacter succinogenes major paralogous domain-containing protein [Muribaculaceae bacterium]
MKKIKSIYILPLALLAACSDDIKMPDSPGIDADGNVNVSFSIPEMNTVSTRSADEWGIGSFQMIVADGQVIGQVTDFDLSDLQSNGTNKYKLNFQLLDGLKNNNNLTFYFLANGSGEVSKGDALSALTGKTILSLPADGGKMVMSAKTALSNIKSGNEWGIGSFQMIVADGQVIGQVTDFDLSDLQSNGTNKYKLNFQLLDGLKNNNNLTFYFLANGSGEVSKGDALSALTGKTILSLPADGGKMVMSAKTALSNIKSGNEVVLYRNDAKVTVSGATIAADGSITPNPTEKYPYAVFGTAVSSSIVAGADINNLILGTPVSTTLPASISAKPSEIYVHPTKNTDDKAYNSYVIVKAPYSGVEYYYRLDFQEKKNATETTPWDIKPNHHYQVLITGVKGAGYATPTEAAANPNTMIEYVIHDHAPVVYNMITDGLRELGVSHIVEKNGNDDAYLYVKTYSKISEEEANANISISSNEQWIDFEYVGEASESEMGGSITDNNGNDTKGKVFKYKAKFDNTKTTPGSISGSVKVSWTTLSREVPVKWIREFDGAMLCDVKLTVRNHSNQIQWDLDEVNYWDFLKNNAYGVTTKANNGNVRNAGLHFPVMYGGGGNNWKYEYTVTLKEEVCPPGSTIKVEVDETSSANFNLEIGNVEGRSFTVKRIITSEYQDWQYAVGRLNIYVGGVPYSLDLYHTGFFHKDSQSHRADTKDATHYYYYEVVSAGNRHWLDRNLGAKSAEYYIEGVPAYSDASDAAGGYFRVAEYDKYNVPKVYSDLCPPGFTLPSQSDWDDLRKSSGFSTALFGTDYLAQFASQDKMIYFPKALYMDESTKTGDARCGYYWTSSAFNGTEKEEVGNWLKCLVFSGNSTYTMSGKVQGKDSKNGFAMAVRCIDASTSGNSVHVTRLNVKGATHVYLYTEKNGVRTATSTWPGHSIGNY